MCFFSTRPETSQYNPDLHLVFKQELRKTSLAESFSRLPFRVFPPFYSADHCCAYTYVVNPTPGFLGGDRANAEIMLESHSHAFITTPSATKILNTGPDHAEQTTRIRIADNAILEYFPSYVIPFAGSRFEQRMIVHLEEGSTCILLDWFSTGRVSHGENLAFEEYNNSVVITCEGKPIVLDRFVLRPRDEDYSVIGRLESSTVSASLYVLHKETEASPSLIEGIRDLLQQGDTVAGVSSLSARGLAVRVMAGNIPSVQKTLFQLIRFIRKTLLEIEDDRMLARVLKPL